MTLVCFKYLLNIENIVNIFTACRTNLWGQICQSNTPSGYDVLLGYITRAMNYSLKVHNASNLHMKYFLRLHRHNGQ